MTVATQSLIKGWRIKTVLAVFVIGLAYIGAHLFKLQIVDHPVMAERVEQLTTYTETILPNRGLIRDARGYLLAGNTLAYDLYLSKEYKKEDELRQMSELLGPAIGEAPEDLYRRIMGVTNTTILLQRRLDKEEASRVQQLKTSWKKLMARNVWLDDQPARSYPNGTFASHVLGFTDYDGNGQYGVEQFYNDALAGTPGWVTAQRDSAGFALPMGEPRQEHAKDGADIYLTIDSAVQDLAERELDFTMKETGAESGMILIMDPHSGEIVALAIAPRFDPNHFTEITDWGILKNPAVSSVYEPGSTFKVITLGSSIDAGAVTPDTTFNCSGVINVYGWSIANSTHTAHGIESMNKGLSQSCNIAADFAATSMGETRFYQYLQNFGFGQPTGVEMAGEVDGTLWLPSMEEYSAVNLYTNAFGQALSVTPVQLVAAVSALVNGGNLMQPRIIGAVTNEGRVDKVSPTVVRRVISPEASEAIKYMMVWGVENTTNNPARVKGYHVGAKTGTAQIPNPDGPGYLDVGTIASVIGFAPEENPRFVALVRLDKPKSSQWGGQTASPAFARLAKELLQYWKIPPTVPDDGGGG